mmetsp:Transcript_31989/g.96545  ORF Transcript_31989/g.96545 Transcript_31989/m.96545 type:complete len:373 (+) Transcript_31989:62-1180(+)
MPSEGHRGQCRRWLTGQVLLVRLPRAMAVLAPRGLLEDLAVFDPRHGGRVRHVRPALAEHVVQHLAHHVAHGGCQLLQGLADAAHHGVLPDISGAGLQVVGQLAAVGQLTAVDRRHDHLGGRCLEDVAEDIVEAIHAHAAHQLLHVAGKVLHCLVDALDGVPRVWQGHGELTSGLERVLAALAGLGDLAALGAVAALAVHGRGHCPALAVRLHPHLLGHIGCRGRGLRGAPEEPGHEVLVGAEEARQRRLLREVAEEQRAQGVSLALEPVGLLRQPRVRGLCPQERREASRVQQVVQRIDEATEMPAHASFGSRAGNPVVERMPPEQGRGHGLHSEAEAEADGEAGGGGPHGSRAERRYRRLPKRAPAAHKA